MIAGSGMRAVCRWSKPTGDLTDERDSLVGDHHSNG
jgi:hypothetical protein